MQCSPRSESRHTAFSRLALRPRLLAEHGPHFCRIQKFSDLFMPQHACMADPEGLESHLDCSGGLVSGLVNLLLWLHLFPLVTRTLHCIVSSVSSCICDTLGRGVSLLLSLRSSILQQASTLKINCYKTWSCECEGVCMLTATLDFMGSLLLSMMFRFCECSQSAYGNFPSQD